MRRLTLLAVTCCTCVATWASGPAVNSAHEPRARTIDDCAALQRDAPESYEPYQCYWAMARQQAQTTAALRQLDALIALDADNYKARLYRGVIGCDNSLPTGPADVRAALAAATAAKDYRGEVYGWITLVFWSRQRTEIDTLHDSLAQADAAATLSGADDLLRMVRAQRAWQSYRDGEYGLAYAAYRRMADEIEGQPLDVSNWEVVDGLAASAWAMYRYDEAIAAYRRVEEYLHSRGARYQEASLAANLISVLGFADASRTEIEAEQQKLLALSEVSGNIWIRPTALRLRADSLPPLQARENYERALALASASGRREEVVRSLVGLGESLLLKPPRDVARGVAVLDQAVSQGRLSGDRSLWVSALSGRARVLWDAGQFDRARAGSLAVLSELERSRELFTESVRARVFARWGDVFRHVAAQMLSHASEGGQPEADLAEAFLVIERLRARDLLDQQADAASQQSREQQALEQERRQVVDRITRLQKLLLDPAIAVPARDAALQQLERLETDEIEVRERASRARHQHPINELDFVSLDTLQAMLRPDQALLSYSLATRLDGASASWLIAVTRNAAHAYPLPKRQHIDRAVRFFSGLIERRDGAERAGAKRLYDDLLAPALSELPATIRELVIVPDASLHTLPFVLLRADENQPSIGQRFAITTVPSATVWLRAAKTTRDPAAEAVLVLADPELPSGDSRPSLSRDWSTLGAIGLGELPFARTEARGLAETVADSDVRLGADASERFLKQVDLSRYGIVHLAAHALVDIDTPERSAVLLSPGNDREDGLLQSREISALDLRGRVVVLSACRSAGGMLLPGEGPMGLSHAFFRAGARAVIGSLWPVRDDDAEVLIREFYARLAIGQSLTAAMSGARSAREAIGAPASAWAGFTVMGDGDYVPFHGGARAPFPRWSWALVALVATVLGLLFWRRR